MKKYLYLGILAASLISISGCSTSKEQSQSTQSNQPITIYLVRHGQTFFNTTDQVQGFSDSPLTKKGVNQAKEVGKHLSNIKFDTAFSSDLGRQRNTAKEILSENNSSKPELIEHDGFKEWNYGGYEGRDNEAMWNPIMEKYGLKFDENWTDYEKLHEKLGDKGIADAIASNDPLHVAETYNEITTRGKKAMDEVIKQTQEKNGKNVLIVSSGSMIPTLLEITVPSEYKGEDIGNCSVTILKYQDKKYKLETIGDNSFLKK